MMIKTSLIPVLLSTVIMTVDAAELNDDDIKQCHHYSSLATQYQIAKQQGKTLEQALKNNTNPNDRIVANKVYKDIDINYNVAEMRKSLFQQCVKSLSDYREHEVKS